MKLDQEQKGFIKARLQSLTYVQETYEELYDHVLTALENVAEDVPFGNAAYRIIEHDLGGKRGIRAMQRKYIWIAIKDFVNAYITCLAMCFKLAPAILIGISTSIYYILMANEMIKPHAAVTIAILSLFPGAWRARKLYESSPWSESKPRLAMVCVGSYASVVMINLSWGIWLSISSICHYIHVEFNTEAYYYGRHISVTTVNIATIFFCIALLHSFTYYKLYRYLLARNLTTT